MGLSKGFNTLIRQGFATLPTRKHPFKLKNDVTDIPVSAIHRGRKGNGGAHLDKGKREVIIHMHTQLGMSPDAIAPLIPSPRRHGIGVCVRSVKDVIRHHEANNNVDDKPRANKRRDMNEAHASMLLDIAKEQPDLHLDQISEELENQCGVQYDPNLCYRELRRRGKVLKVMARVAAQRDEYSRFLYWEEITALGVRPDQICFLDETGVDSRIRQVRGWGNVGERVELRELLHRGEHISVLALFSFTGFLDFDHIVGGYSGEDVLRVFEDMVVPQLGSYDLNESNSVVVCDNCTAHRMYEDALIEMVESAGARLVYLAAYSPIDNPIEMGFNVFKACWKREKWLEARAVEYRVRYCLENCYAHPEEAAAATYRECGLV